MTQPTRAQRTRSAIIASGIIGLLCGVLIGSTFSQPNSVLLTALNLAVLLGLSEGITDALRQPGSGKPLVHRVMVSVVIGAALGALLRALPPIVIGGIIGLLGGALTLGPRKLVIGILTGLVIGALSPLVSEPLNTALMGGGVVLVFRVLIVLLYRDTAPFELAGERVPPEQARFVVPYEAHSEYIGTGYMEQLAQEKNGLFQRNRADIGIVATMDALRGPHFDPMKVDPRIREFYEHTSRFRLQIIPEWNPFIRPFFWIFKTTIAQRIGQANLPFNMEEAQRGVVSYIDTIDFPGDETGVQTLRGWIRAFEAGEEPIYVGIYTVLRHDEVGYVSVGFPLPEGNFTATLLPYNHQNGHFLLKTDHTGFKFPGHYLSVIEEAGLTTLKLTVMGEEIEVYLREGALKTDHRFYFGGLNFLTLYYTIEHK
ncbi:MAG: hypothetical protein OHK0046_31710 [Anaerolineae bacterium]